MRKFRKMFFLMLLAVSNVILSQTRAKVIGIKDGDTVLVLDKDNNQVTLRLAEVDCPEKGQAFDKNAKQFTSDLVYGKQIKYYKTSSDRYGRIIAKVYFNNGKYLSEEIIKNGFGWWYYQYSSNKDLGELESEARSLKLGLWSGNETVSPWEWRKAKREASKKKRELKLSEDKIKTAI
ncbi:micrococcal nuclease [Chryseobacterium sp. H1D6B]|uniref:thermonuclease family protein n=1 Tax=Chryseobacterium sp. H1D6B TaxID=2940588 RepID=UPI0015CDB2C3|nr:thermonuclease family protein [Chryseobacterium sp. H1D6B]MDH6253143.1 micrococcal nuclease [Chryseobacterium sp. H1D6B]